MLSFLIDKKDKISLELTERPMEGASRVEDTVVNALFTAASKEVAGALRPESKTCNSARNFLLLAQMIWRYMRGASRAFKTSKGCAKSCLCKQKRSCDERNF